VRPLWQPGKNQPTALAEKIGDEVVGEGFHQVLLIVIARQVAHRRDRDADTWQDARPLCPGSFSNRRQGSLGLGFGGELIESPGQPIHVLARHRSGAAADH